MRSFKLRPAASLLMTLWLGLRRALGGPYVAAAPPRRILVLGYAAIGDLLFFMPALAGLRRNHPNAKIVFLANAYPTTQELVPATGLVDEVWLWQWEGPGAPADPAPILRRIREARFDVVVLTLPSPAHYFQSAIWDIPVRVGHCRRLAGSLLARLRRGLITGEFARRALLDRQAWIGAASEHAVTRNLRLLDVMGVPRPPDIRPRIPLSEGSRHFAQDAAASLAPGRKLVAVHLGPPRNQYSKIWPVERFAQLCARLHSGLGVEILLVGSAEEADNAAAVLKACPQVHSWVGKASLLETCGLIARCGLFVGNDTGLAKAALVLGVPTVTIYGPTDPQELGALWDPDQHLDLRRGLACSPCVRLGMAQSRDGVLDYTCCGHHACLQGMDVDTVYGAICAKYAGRFKPA
ncbi:MAG: glycosyltransferase family 9 protein [Elusimicrobiota bacterium]|jgi:ADP-heptose:LPS heptosyltransferase